MQEQDSFDARMQGQTPADTKAKSGKGWMICSIILMVIIVAFGTFGAMIIMKGDRDTNRLSDVESQLKEKEEKIESLEKQIAESSKLSNYIDIDYEGLNKILLTKSKNANGDYDMGVSKIELLNVSKDGKYLYGKFTLTPLINSDKLMAGSTFVYKTLPDGQWQNAGVYTDGVDLCEKHSKEVLEILIDAGYGDTWKCQVKEGDANTITAQEYYKQKYEKE